MAAYYNEIDPYTAQWLRNLIAAGHIAPGDVDERDIGLVHPVDLLGYTQCHFFAGIGVWSYALRLAGWADDRPVWSGSCPCQPFSAAGKGEGTSDARHLWPAWFRLIREHRPVAVFGEQVSAAIRHSWLDLVSADMEGAGYAIGAAVVGAHSVGAPHIRQRLFFVADAKHAEWRAERQEHGDAHRGYGFGGRCHAGELADSQLRATERYRQSLAGEASGTQGEAHERQRLRTDARDGLAVGELADSAGFGQLGGQQRDGGEQEGERSAIWQQVEKRSVTGGFWKNAGWIDCVDGRKRAVEPGTFPLAHGATARVGRLRAYGNAINAQAAAEFIRAYDCR